MGRNQVLFDRRQLLIGAAGIGVAAAVSAPKDAIGQPLETTKKKISVRGLDMAYYEVGQGRPIVFIHGNPTSSYQWRKIIPYVEGLGRCVAPDMIGMGDSDPLPNSGPGVYTYQTHRDYMFELLDTLGISDNVIFVVHDWGSAMGFEWAYHHPDQVRGIAYYEAMVRAPDIIRPEPVEGPFAVFRSAAGEKAVLEDNMFVERLITRLEYYLSDEEIAEYRRPYLQPGESRRPTLEWPRELPFEGNPKRNYDIMREYSDWLAQDTRIPKLFMRGEPGAIFSSEPLLRFVQSFPNQKEVTIYGRHRDVDGVDRACALADAIHGLVQQLGGCLHGFGCGLGADAVLAPLDRHGNRALGRHVSPGPPDRSGDRARLRAGRVARRADRCVPWQTLAGPPIRPADPPAPARAFHARSAGRGTPRSPCAGPEAGRS